MNVLLRNVLGLVALLVIMQCLAIILACIRPAWFPWVIGQPTTWSAHPQRMDEWKTMGTQKESLDLLFFGSSTCLSGINPHYFEAIDKNAFSFCSLSQTLGHSEILIQTALRDAPNVSTILLDIYPSAWDFPLFYPEACLDWILNAPLPGQSVTEFLAWYQVIVQMGWHSGDPHALLLALCIPVLRCMNLYKNPAQENRKSTYIGKGFVARSHPGLEQHPNCQTYQVSMPHEHCNALDRIKVLCDAKDIDLILVNPPQLCPEEWTSPACFEPLTLIDGMSWPGADSLPFFRDGHHLVVEGSHHYSKWLADVLSSIPGRR